MFRVLPIFLLIMSYSIYGFNDDWLDRNLDDNEIVYTAALSDRSNPIIVFGPWNVPTQATREVRTFLENHGGSVDYQFLSNFYNQPITVDGRTYRTSEHYYQATKFEIDSPVYREIVDAISPDIAKKTARAHEREALVVDEQDMIKRMKKALKAKFVKEDGSPSLLGMKLLATGDRLIIEGNYRISADGKNMSDKRWGAELDLASPDSITMRGKNFLGKLLMELRSDLQSRILLEHTV